MTRRLAAAFAVSICLLVSAPARASDPLPVYYGGGYLPPTTYFKEGTAKISVAMVSHLREVSKCYRHAASDAFRFRTDNLPNCLGKAGQKLSASIAFLTLRGYVPVCVDMNALGASMAALVSTSAPQTWCDASSGRPLPPSVGGGWVPTDSFRVRSTNRLQHNLVEYFGRVTSCYWKGVAQTLIGQPDGVEACLAQGLARYNDKINRLERVLPPCVQTAVVNMGLAWASEARALNPLIYCQQ